MKTHNDISGAVLAGGQNSRMGSHKAFVKLASARIIDLTLGVMKPLFEEVIIVANDKDLFRGFKGVKVIEDFVMGCGPLGGIYTGLEAATNKKVFFTACDMPFLYDELVSNIITISREANYDCVVPRTSLGLEPLHAVYSKKIIETVKKALEAGDFSIRQLLNQCRCKYVDVEDRYRRSFFNINTPEDLEKTSYKE